MARILSVEDNPINQLLVTQKMKMLGHEVFGVEDAELALQFLSNTSDIDLILLDIGLPKLDGIELARLISENNTLKHIPIIFLTAHATVDYKEKANQIGINDFFTKPINFSQLTDRVNEILAV